MWQLAEDTITNDDIEALADWLLTHPRLTAGPLVTEFESAWAEWVGTDYAVMVSSGTTANFALVAAAARLVQHTPVRIGVSAVTWSTNISPSLLMGHDVTIFDVDPTTLGVDEERVVSAMDRGELDILFVTHLLGFNALTDHIVEAAERNNVILLEDCCESHGARFGDEKVGSVGLGSTFSFYFGHHMSTIEGGVISTNDASLVDELKLMRAHGLARESSQFDEYAKRYATVDRRFLFVRAGLNFRSTDLNAFLGLRQLEALDDRIAVRNRNLTRFLKGIPDYLWKDYRLDGVSSFALPLIATSTETAAIVRSVVDDLEIESRPVVAGNLARQPFLDEYSVTVDGDTPVADQIDSCGLYVGNGHHVSEAMIDRLLDGLRRNQK